MDIAITWCARRKAGLQPRRPGTCSPARWPAPHAGGAAGCTHVPPAPHRPCRLGVYPNPATDPWPTLKPIPNFPPPLNLDPAEGLEFLVRQKALALPSLFTLVCAWGHGRGHMLCIYRIWCSLQPPTCAPAPLPGMQRNYWNNPANGRTGIKRTLVHMLSGQLTPGGGASTTSPMRRPDAVAVPPPAPAGQGCNAISLAACRCRYCLPRQHMYVARIPHPARPCR